MKIAKPEETEERPAVTVVRKLSPAEEIEQIIRDTASMTRFRKLALASDLMFHIQGTLCYQEPTFYLSKGDGHNIGDLKDEGYEFRTVALLMTNCFDFGAQAFWQERFPKFRDGTPKPPVFEFEFAKVGGQRSGRQGVPFFHQSTKMTEEINRCLSA